MRNKTIVLTLLLLFIIPFLNAEEVSEFIPYHLRMKNQPFSEWSDERKLNLYIMIGCLLFSLFLYGRTILRIYRETGITKKALFKQCILWFFIGGLVVWFFKS